MERFSPASRRDSGIGKPSPPAIRIAERITPFHPVQPLPHSTEPPLCRNGVEIPNAEAGIAIDEPSGQIFPAPAPEVLKAYKRDETTAALLTKLRTPYDRYEKHLKRIQKKLKRSAPSDDEPSNEILEACEPPPTRSYLTPMGTFSFQELHERTRKYTAYALRVTYQFNVADIDDGLQAGYLRLWQRLEGQPELLADKALAWIGKGIIYTALHATRNDWQFRKKTQVDDLQVKLPSEKGNFAALSWESRQTEIRIDLHRAIGEVAEHILTKERGKRQEHDLWALYGLTMQQVSASELSRLFGVREQSMQAAYNRVRHKLQEALPNYTSPAGTTLYVRRGRETLPSQNVSAIKKANGNTPQAVYEAVRTVIETINADTRKQDELALEGIRQHISSQTQARTHGMSQSIMQRAYTRVHLMIGAERDPTVRTRRPERRRKFVFTLTAASAATVEQLALDLLEKPKSYEKLVALHAHISNLAISTTAKHFNIPTSTLRYYEQQIGAQLGTPTKPAREE